MRFAFSTLGCPGLPVPGVAELAARNGFDGVEVRTGDDEPVNVGLDAAARRAAATALGRAGVIPLSVASYVKVADEGADDDAVVADGIAHGRLAADLGAEYLRVFPGGRQLDRQQQRDRQAQREEPGQRDRQQRQDDAAARRLLRIVDGLRGCGVTVALETHDSHPTGADCMRILEASPGTVAIWDALHPWRAGEMPRQTAALLSGRLGYVQVKDVASADDLAPLAPGHGILPLAEMAVALRGNGYDGWVSWEYERAWFPRAPDLALLAGPVIGWMRRAFG